MAQRGCQLLREGVLHPALLVLQELGEVVDDEDLQEFASNFDALNLHSHCLRFVRESALYFRALVI